MGGKKKNKKKILERNVQESSTFTNYSVPARNLRKTELGAVIFGCKHSTINECLSNNLFGLPANHFSYIKNIKEGLVLFLFNYSDRKLHGIFEAASCGEMNIDPYAWVADDDDYAYTSYPAQVRVRVRQQCHPLSENQFGPVIADNYYENQHFYFELDHNQTKKLVSLFKPIQTATRSNNSNIPLSSFPVPVKRQANNLNQTSGFSYASVVGGQLNSSTTTSCQPTGTWSSLFKTESTSEQVQDQKHDDFGQENNWEDYAEAVKTCESDWGSEVNDTIRDDEVPLKEEHEHEEDYKDGDEVLVADTWKECGLVDNDTTAINEAECVQTNTNTDKLPSSSTSQPLDDNPDRQVSSSGKSDVEEIQEEDNSLAPPCTNIESLVVKLMQEVEGLKGSHLNQNTSINQLQQQLVKSKLEIMQLRNRIEVLESGSPRSVAVDPVSVDSHKNHHAKISNSVFFFGGYDGCSWLPCLDSYYPSYDIRIPLSPMNFVKTYASAATVNGELYHFGGGTVESYSPKSNQWVLRPPSLRKNINVAGTSANEKLYVVGGSKDCHCSSDAEYLDLNLGKWIQIQSMNTKRLSPAAAEINNVLYVTGGFDGKSYSSSVERFDPREGKWTKLADMNRRKGCHSMVVLNEKLYTLGGHDGEKYVDMMESFDTRMGGCWVESEPMNVSRAYFGAFVLGEKLYAVGGSIENNKISDIVECYKEGSCWEVLDVNAIGKRSHFSAIVL